MNINSGAEKSFWDYSIKHIKFNICKKRSLFKKFKHLNSIVKYSRLPLGERIMKDEGEFITV
ncbi:hypothetical protein SAMN03097699_3148 [Flavobacteriaceae bacterium MAR_2010_188]|nr:hypothetical protein SAMN03097699_3148 [Flavobacteriaceae bacterium MAR_2010_188]